MNRHLDGSPKQAVPIWLREHEWLRVRCACRRRASLHIEALALQHRLAPTVRM